MSQIREITLSDSQDWLKVWLDLKSEFADQTVILLNGPVGSGKTTSLQYLAQILNLSEISSPTFALHQRYQGSVFQLDHVDLYRMRSLDEIEDVGFWDLFDQKKALIVVEWSNMIPEELWPLHFKKIKLDIQVNSNAQRVLKIESVNSGVV